MKFIKYITPALFCAALTLQSCEHFLDTKPMESYSEDLVWSLKSTADAFVLQTYNNVLPFYHDIRTEEQWTLNSVMRQNCPNEARDLMNRDWSWGFNQFGTIRRCNLIIEKSQASTGLSDADKKALVAEGKMLRAMTYYYIAKHCGRVIWVDHVLAETDEFNLPLTESIDKTYDLILKDIDARAYQCQCSPCAEIRSMPDSCCLQHRRHPQEVTLRTGRSCSRRYTRIHTGQQLRQYVQPGWCQDISRNHSGTILQQR